MPIWTLIGILNGGCIPGQRDIHINTAIDNCGDVIHGETNHWQMKVTSSWVVSLAIQGYSANQNMLQEN